MTLRRARARSSSAPAPLRETGAAGTLTEEVAPRRRGLVVAALMLAIGLAAIDSTIVATAIPQIVGDLGGFSKFPWLFSIYLLAH